MYNIIRIGFHEGGALPFSFLENTFLNRSSFIVWPSPWPYGVPQIVQSEVRPRAPRFPSL